MLDGSGFKIQIGDVIGRKLVTRLINYKALSFLFILRNLKEMGPFTPDKIQLEPGVDMNAQRKEIIILTGTPPLGR